MIPLVSIIIPCRNEEKFIGKCLESIIQQDFPKENLEVLVVDGMSGDGTRGIIGKYKIQDTKYKIQILDNPKKFTNFALSIGIKESRGEVIMLMGAHAGYEKNYVSKCVKYLNEYDADNVGGVMKTLPLENTLVAKAIALCLSHSFGVGGSLFRKGADKPKWVDTVFGGCYKKEVFDKIGMFNENLIRSQDMEFNLRLKKAGGKILLHPEIVSYYYPKSGLGEFFWHNFEDGIWAVLPLKFVKAPFKLRHYIPLLFVLGIILTLIFGSFSFLSRFLFVFIFGSYLILNLFFSAQIAIRERDFRLLFLTPIAFACRHFGYGLGSVWGLLKIISKI